MSRPSRSPKVLPSKSRQPSSLTSSWTGPPAAPSSSAEVKENPNGALRGMTQPPGGSISWTVGGTRSIVKGTDAEPAVAGRVAWP